MQNEPVHFELPVNDPEKMSKFYSEAFGWNFQSAPMVEGQTYWMISTGPEGKTLNGGMYKKMGPDEFLRIYVGDPDLEGAISRVEKAGGSLINKFDIPGVVTGALMYDPEKNVVGIIKNQSQDQSQGEASMNTRASASRKKSKSRASRKKKTTKRKR